jgi:hypothetical protein
MAVNYGDLIKGILSKPENQSALIKSGFDVFGSVLAGKGAENQQREAWARTDGQQLRDRSFDLADQRLGQHNADFSLRQGQQDNADQTVLGAMGRSPLQFSMERARSSALADMLERGSPANLGVHGGPFAGGLSKTTVDHYRPSAAKEEPYWNSVAQASKGRFAGPGLGASYGASGALADSRIGDRTAASGDAFEGDWTQFRQGTQDLQRQSEAQVADERKRLEVAQQQQSSGGGFGGLLKTFAPLTALIPGVGPFMAAGLTAGANAVGTKLQGGSWGDAAKSGIAGAATGAGTSLANRALRDVLSRPLTQTGSPEWAALGNIPLGSLPRSNQRLLPATRQGGVGVRPGSFSLG